MKKNISRKSVAEIAGVSKTTVTRGYTYGIYVCDRSFGKLDNKSSCRACSDS